MAIVHIQSVIVVNSGMLSIEALMMFRRICISIVPLSSSAVIEMNTYAHHGDADDFSDRSNSRCTGIIKHGYQNENSYHRDTDSISERMNRYCANIVEY
jgi:hypothetical protein